MPWEGSQGTFCGDRMKKQYKLVLRDKVIPVLKKLLVLLCIVGFIVSSVFLTMNLYSIHTNTNNLKLDSSKQEVTLIDAEENLYGDNFTIEGDDIQRYVKVEKDAGTWYIEENGILVVEATFSDFVKTLVFWSIYFIGVVIWSIMSLVKYGKESFKIRFVFSTLLVLISSCYITLWWNMTSMLISNEGIIF